VSLAQLLSVNVGQPREFAWRGKIVYTVADRFGLWGPFGDAGVAWGDFDRFTVYTARLLGGSLRRCCC
jgi:hypothetical protein